MTENSLHEMLTSTELSDDQWYDAVVRECKWRGYAEWFYCCRQSWLEQKEMGETPLEAIETNLDCL